MPTPAEDKLIVTPDQAASLLPDGDTVHNFVNPGAGMFVGCDYSRDDTLKAFHEAVQIEIGGDNSKSMKHPIVCWHSNKRLSFFEADMDKLAAFEADRASAAKAEGTTP